MARIQLYHTVLSPSDLEVTKFDQPLLLNPVLFEASRAIRITTYKTVRRLLVLSLQGDILQVVTNPTNPTAKFTSICCFDRKLLASYRYREAFGSPWKYGMLALQGL